MTENPWLKITLDEYLGHMTDSHVRQHQMLNRIFYKAYFFKKPVNLLILGVTDGNGLEYVSDKITSSVFALDINPNYIERARSRFQQILPQCQFICADIAEYQFPENYFDMVHGALIFEYIDYHKLLGNIALSLKLGGVLSTVMQQEDAMVSRISETKYASLKNLASVMKMVDISAFQTEAAKRKLEETHHEIVKPYGPKSFYYGIFKKTGC